MASHGHEAPASFIEALHADVVAHACGQLQPDDLTVVVIKRTARHGASNSLFPPTRTDGSEDALEITDDENTLISLRFESKVDGVS